MNICIFKAVFRDGFRNIIIMVIVLFCIIASSNIYQNLTLPNKEKIEFTNRENEQALYADYSDGLLRVAAEDIADGTMEGLKAFQNYDLWRIQLCEKNIAHLQNGTYFTKEYQEEIKRDKLLDYLFELQFYSNPDKGTVDKKCAKELEKHKRYLRLNEIPFDYRQLAYCYKGTYKTIFAQGNDNYSLKAKLSLSTIDNGTIEFESKSPYVFLSSVLGDVNGFSLVMSLTTLFFSMAIVMKWKQKKSFYCICNLNISNDKYYKRCIDSIIGFMISIFVLCVGVFFIFWGIQGGLNGLNCKTPYVADNFDSFNIFDHISKFDRLCVSKMYYDFYFDFKTGLFYAGTRHPYALMKVWQLFLASGVLAFVKMLFYVMLGAGIGFIFVDKSKIIAGGIVAGVLCVTSQLFFSTNKFNPFSVGNSFNTTMGGEGMTYLNAMLVLIVSIVIMYTGIMYVIRNKDIC